MGHALEPLNHASLTARQRRGSAGVGRAGGAACWCRVVAPVARGVVVAAVVVVAPVVVVGVDR